MKRALVVACVLQGCAAPTAVDAGPAPRGVGGPAACADADPLTNASWVGFCADRRDDNCAPDLDEEACADPASFLLCQTDDEPCPQTQPASAAPDWDCTGEPPGNVVAVARYEDDGNEAVRSFCAFVYESPIVPGEHYAAMRLENGPRPQEPDGKCLADQGARRHLFFSNLDEGACDGVRYRYPAELRFQVLSNACRKMIRNVARVDGTFEPDIQYFAATREEALAKLDVLETAEIACIGIDGSDGRPYRPNEVWVVQAAAPLVRTR